MARLDPAEGFALEDRDDLVGDPANEIWKSVHPAYEVSNLGRVRRTLAGPGTWAGRVLKPRVSGKGYRSVSLSHNGVVVAKLVHRLVAEAFIGECPLGMEINHEDGDKSNNALSNLEYVTSQENTKHAYAVGLCRRAKLGKSDVVEIKKLVASGETVASVARSYGVTRGAVSKIKHGRTWGHVEVCDGAA